MTLALIVYAILCLIWLVVDRSAVDTRPWVDRLMEMKPKHPDEETSWLRS